MWRLAAGLLLAGASWSAPREIVLFDTDSCLFCDDGPALVMLVRSPSQIALHGITLVPGNVWPDQGAEYMYHLLDLLKRPTIPIYAGAHAPLLHTREMVKEAETRWGKHEYIGAFGDNPADVKPAPGFKRTGRKPKHDAAVEFLVSEIERYPGEVTILALGPLTNIALALRMKPEIETKIKRIVMMGGNVHVGGNASAAAEFNFWFDPEAARIVLRSRIPQKYMFGLDISNTAPIRKAHFDELIAVKTPITDLIKEDWGNRYPGFLKDAKGINYFWDALAAAWLLDPGYVTKWETLHLDVQTQWGKFYGSTVPLDRKAAPHCTPVQVALQLDFKRVWSLFKQKMQE
jgi:inosine-uridine nucleoside N-ribohydrolase